MSWQRIFEVARERKLPIIVTDLAGREPMVVMPLEEYEKLSDHAPSILKELASLQEKPTVIPIKNEQPESVPFPSIPPNSDRGAIEDALSLEERFYLEPMDEESNI
ncbi:hypothetical protein FJZ48_00645 [Candidatus Uhrbacteria bacterium]|nr:hypothetical protein [Candidatus Uhrbacteria bacterium]